MPEPIVSVDSLTFHYPTKTALENVSFSIYAGQIIALVGPNGAGKTTLMRCLAGLDVPFAGKIRIDGIDVLEDPRAAHARIGYLSDSFGLYDELTVRQSLTYIGGCHNLQGRELSLRIDWVIKILHLEPVIDQTCLALSRGWRQRVGIAMSIIKKPSILILDEPASGLDPEARAELSHVLKTLRSEGTTVMVSSHILAELEEYCTAMLVIRDGKIKSSVDLASQQTIRNVVIHVRLSEDIQPEQESALRSKHSALVMHDSRHFELQAQAGAAVYHDILKDFMGMNLAVSAFTPEEKKLQTLYLEIASHSQNG